MKHLMGHPAGADARTVESIQTTLRLRQFTYKRFHVLLNSLFKVLFNVPSRYLFAIGLAPVFSLRRSLPPTSGCIPKQPDSRDCSGQRDRYRQRPGTRYGKGPARGDFGIFPRRLATSRTPQFQPSVSHGGFGAGLLPLHSPLLG